MTARAPTRSAALTSVGYWSALACAAGAIGYGAVSIGVAAVAAEAITYESYAAFVADYSLLPTMAVLLPPFVVTLAFPVLVVALHTLLPSDRRPLGLLALAFAGIYSAILGSAYWLQLTYVPWNIMRGAGEEVAPWIMWNPASFFWAFETFAYFAMGIACLIIGVALAPATMPRRIKVGLVAMGAIGLYFMLASLKDPILNPAHGAAWATAWALSAVFAWVIVFGFLALSLAGWFAVQRRGLQRTGGIDESESAAVAAAFHASGGPSTDAVP